MRTYRLPRTRPVTVKCTKKFIKIVLIQSGFERDERA